MLASPWGQRGIKDVISPFGVGGSKVFFFEDGGGLTLSNSITLFILALPVYDYGDFYATPFGSGSVSLVISELLTPRKMKPR